MAENRNFEKIVIALMAAAVLLCFLAVFYSDRLTELLGGTGVRMGYEAKLFDTDEIISVNILMEEDEWNSMLNNAMSEEYYVCDVVVNGQRFYNVAIRPKGNTSLSAIAMDTETDRFSLKLEFDHFVKGQKCFGLDKLILNNNYADATNMKEAIIFDMYQYLGATASLYNYAKVSLNGEYWGLYLALESVEDSFLLRNFGTEDGELYKPDSMEMGGGDSSKDSAMPSGSGGMTPPSGSDSFPSFSESGGNKPPSMDGFAEGFSFTPGDMPEDFDFSSLPNGTDSGEDDRKRREGGSSDDSGEKPEGSFDFSSRPDSGSAPSGFGGFSMGNGGSNLNYTDDDLDSYSTIWEGEITKTGKKDHRRVVTALKNIHEGNDLETYLNVDNILKYMAVHTFSVNMDSLSGSMAHNYYLYEYNGQLDIFPWDYNLSFGGMSMGSDGSATDMVNDPIDTPFSGTRFFDALLSNEEYLERYHEYLRKLVDEYVNGGKFDETYRRIRNQIDSLVETDPTAFYPYDEYCTAADLLYETVKLRAESIEGQLNGTIPSTDEGQRQDSSSLIDASHIDVKAMGQFNMGGGSDGFFGGRSERKNRKPSSSENTEETSPKGSGMPEGFDPSSLPEDFDPSSFSGFGSGNFPDSGDSRPNASSENAETEGKQETSTGSTAAFGPGGEAPSSFSGMPGQPSGNTRTKTIVTYGSCLVLLLIALLAAWRFRRKL